MNNPLRRPISAAICCLALAWTASASAGTDKQGATSQSDRVAATSDTSSSSAGGQPTAGGNSAEPERTKKGSGPVGPTSGRAGR